jgi:hypothetical protein
MAWLVERALAGHALLPTSILVPCWHNGPFATFVGEALWTGRAASLPRSDGRMVQG